MLSMRIAAILLALLILSQMLAGGEAVPKGPWDKPPPLPKPKGKTVKVKAGDARDLQNKVRGARSDTTILVPPGTYRLTAPLRFGVTQRIKNVALRGIDENRDQAIIRGPGMRVDSADTVPHCLMIEQAEDVLIANLSIGDVWFHPITIQGTAGANRVHVYNCRRFDGTRAHLRLTRLASVL